MTMTLKLTAVGEGTGIIFPAELLNKLHLKAGDVLQVQTSDDQLTLTAVDSFEDQLKVAERIMLKRHTLLSKLAE